MKPLTRILAAVMIVVGLALGAITAATAAIRPVPHYIQLGNSGRCVTATAHRPGAEVKALPCAHSAAQQWVISSGVVRLAGTRLRLTISRHAWRAVLTDRRADRWKLGRHYLRDLALSDRFGVRMVLTLPSTVYHRALPGYHLRAAQLLRFVHTKSRIVNQGFQRVRLSPARSPR